MTVDGDRRGGGQAPLPALGPGATGAVTIPGWAPPSVLSGSEAFLTVRFTTADDSAWAPAGFEVGWTQLPIDARTAPDGVGRAASMAGDAAAGGHAGGVPATADAVGAHAAAVATRAGDPAGIALDADGRLVHPLLVAPPALTLFRAPTDNDHFGGISPAWEAAGLARLDRRLVDVSQGGGTTTVRSVIRTGAGIDIAHVVELRGLPGGGIHVDEEATIPDALSDLPRVGTVLELAAGLESLEWLGAGPHETYPDRKRDGIVEPLALDRDRPARPVRRPQESGGHADVRWLELRDPADPARGLRLVFDRPLQASVLHLAPRTSRRRPTTASSGRARRRS